MRIKKGDNVQVLSGNDKGKTGEVLEVIPKLDKVVVKGINIRKKQELMLKLLELNAVGEKIRNYIAKNKNLNDQAMRFINFNINVITGTTADTTYTAQNTGNVITKKKMFDQSI